MTATPWNNSRTDVFHLGRLFLDRNRVPVTKPYREYLYFAPRKAGKAFELDDKAFSVFWEDLFLQRTRKTYGGEEITFATRKFPTVEIIYEPKKQKALENNFERISNLRLPYMNPLRYLNGQGDDFTSERLKLLFLKRADSSWVAFKSTLESINSKVECLERDLLNVLNLDQEIKKNFRAFIANSYGIDSTYDDFVLPFIDVTEDLTDFEINSREKRKRYVRIMTEKIESISKKQAKKAALSMLSDAKNDLEVLSMIREDLSGAFDRIDEKYEAVRDEIVKNAKKGEKVLVISQFRDTTLSYFSRLVNDPKLSGLQIGHVSGKAEDCYIGSKKNQVLKEEILKRFAPIAKNVINQVDKKNEINIVIGTETLSVGQNLQDSRILMNLDLPYNPMILEQRIGRIDRPREKGREHQIEIYTFPSIPVIEAELKMTDRLKVKLEGIFQDTRFDDLVLPEYEEFLRQVLTERGKAVENMIDTTVERTIVPVDAKTHSAKYIKAQERMWRFLERNTLSSVSESVFPDTSFGIGKVGKSVAIVNTILRDVNGQEIDNVRLPIVLDDMESDLVKVEAAWYDSIAETAISTKNLPLTTAKTSFIRMKNQLETWTNIQVEEYNKLNSAKKEVREQLQSKKSKVVAAEILNAVRGQNRVYISECIKEAGYPLKVLKSLTSAIEYIDTRDPEYLEVEELHDDLNELWKNFKYYVEMFIGNEKEEIPETKDLVKRTGRIACIKNSETIWEVGNVKVENE